MPICSSRLFLSLIPCPWQHPFFDNSEWCFLDGTVYESLCAFYRILGRWSVHLLVWRFPKSYNYVTLRKTIALGGTPQFQFSIYENKLQISHAVSWIFWFAEPFQSFTCETPQFRNRTSRDVAFLFRLPSLVFSLGDLATFWHRIKMSTTMFSKQI